MSTCRWMGSTQPRALTGRHLAECEDDTCRGCQPCTEIHCRICAITHSAGTCADCLNETRVCLHDIVRMCGDLMSEAIHKGTTESEAAHLLGPVADPEASGHLRASVNVGRVPADYLADPVGEDHPLWVLGTWEMLWRDALQHDTDEAVTIAEAAHYLDGNMTYMAGFEDVPFEDFAKDLRGCRTHLEVVLHDGEQVDRGVPCMACGATLERTWAEQPKDDGWRCPRCQRTSNEAQYRLAVRADYLKNAEQLTASDMAEAHGIAEGTLRRWANGWNDTLGALVSACVRKRGKDEKGRQMYDVADAKAARDGSPRRAVA